MDLYTFGRLALPVVIVIIGVAGGVTLFYGFGVLLRLIVFLRSLRQKQEKQRPCLPDLGHRAAASPQPSHAGKGLNNFRRGMGAPENPTLFKK